MQPWAQILSPIINIAEKRALPNLVSEGVEPVGNVVMKKAVFTVETISAGMGEVLVYVEDPAGHREEVKDLWFQMFNGRYCFLPYVRWIYVNRLKLSSRPKWQPTMIKIAPTPSSTSLKSQACTRYENYLIRLMFFAEANNIFYIKCYCMHLLLQGDILVVVWWAQLYYLIFSSVS